MLYLLGSIILRFHSIGSLQAVRKENFGRECADDIGKTHYVCLKFRVGNLNFRGNPPQQAKKCHEGREGPATPTPPACSGKHQNQEWELN